LYPVKSDLGVIVFLKLCAAYTAIMQCFTAETISKVLNNVVRKLETLDLKEKM